LARHRLSEAWPKLQYDHPSSKILVTGKSGSGKTTYGLRLLTNGQWDYRFVFDGEGELATRLRLRPAFSPEQCLAAVSGRWVIFDPGRTFSNPQAGLSFFCEWAFTLCERLPGRKIILVDELWKYCNSATVPKELELVVFTGRRVGLDCLFLSQRPNRIHNSIRDALSEVVSFRLQDTNSLKFITENGFDEAAIRNLAPGQFIAMNLDNGAVEEGRVF